MILQEGNCIRLNWNSETVSRLFSKEEFQQKHSRSNKGELFLLPSLYQQGYPIKCGLSDSYMDLKTLVWVNCSINICKQLTDNVSVSLRALQICRIDRWCRKTTFCDENNQKDIPLWKMYLAHALPQELRQLERKESYCPKMQKNLLRWEFRDTWCFPTYHLQD